MSRVVCWAGSGPLLLERVVRNANGSLKSGFVVNGGWNFEIRNNECLAKASNEIVTRWPKPDSIPEVKVPPDKHGDYNDIIEWAMKELS